MHHTRRRNLRGARGPPVGGHRRPIWGRKHDICPPQSRKDVSAHLKAFRTSHKAGNTKRVWKGLARNSSAEIDPSKSSGL